MPPPDAAAAADADIQASWNLIVPVASRPTTPQRAQLGELHFGVILRDAGKVAIYDGDTKQEIVRLDVGFAVHILRSSSSGRYFYAIGRDGLVSMIDLWASTPNIVATVKGCHDARSVDASKFAGYEDNYLIEGCYWPPQYVVYDGLTLEPLARNDLPMQSITGETLPEVRVAVDRRLPLRTAVGGLAQGERLRRAGRLLAAGLPAGRRPSPPRTSCTTAAGTTPGATSWWRPTPATRWWSLISRRADLVTSFTTGNRPHPGRGANWQDPVYGWVNATPHLGEAKVSIYGADPVGVRTSPGKWCARSRCLGSGSLFLKTHPNSPVGAVRHDPEHDRHQETDLRLLQGDCRPRPLLPGGDQRPGDALRVQQGWHRGLGVGLGERMAR